MPELDVGGHALSYEVQGEGPPVLFVHPLFFDRRVFAPQARALADGYTTISVDVRCHGASGCVSEAWDLWEAGADIVTLLDELDVGPVHWVGISMGAMIGMRVALSRPEHVASLVLIDTSAGPEERPRLHTAMARIAKALGRPAIRVMMPYVARQMFSADFRGSDAAQPWFDYVKDADPDRIYWSGRAVFQRDDIRDHVGKLDVPALVMVGEEDEAIPPSRGRWLHEAIEGSRLATLPGAGHLSVVERPERATALIGDFLESVA